MEPGEKFKHKDGRTATADELIEIGRKEISSDYLYKLSDVQYCGGNGDYEVELSFKKMFPGWSKVEPDSLGEEACDEKEATIKFVNSPPNEFVNPLETRLKTIETEGLPKSCSFFLQITNTYYF